MPSKSEIKEDHLSFQESPCQAAELRDFLGEVTPLQASSSTQDERLQETPVLGQLMQEAATVDGPAKNCEA